MGVNGTCELCVFPSIVCRSVQGDPWPKAMTATRGVFVSKGANDVANLPYMKNNFWGLQEVGLHPP